MDLLQFADRVHRLAIEKGWWEGYVETRDGVTRVHLDAANPSHVNMILGKLALVHSEVSEAVEALRVGDIVFRRAADAKPEGLAVELADAVIRIFDLAEALGVNIEQALLEKHYYNGRRVFRHGGKLA